MNPTLITIIALLFPSIALSQSLCGKGELDYFSCETVNKKVISVCGNISNGEITDNSWLQYRFGKKGAIELTYPKEKQGSVSKFEGNYFNRYNVIDLRFINGKTLYGVNYNDSYSGDEAQERTSPSAGVYVEINHAKPVNIQCAKIHTAFTYFGYLNDWLRSYNGETNFHVPVANE